VDEHVLGATLRLDKAEAFGGVEPFHGAIGHRDVSSDLPPASCGGLAQYRSDEQLAPVEETEVERSSYATGYMGPARADYKGKAQDRHQPSPRHGPDPGRFGL
jgi:hypothetical protein